MRDSFKIGLGFGLTSGVITTLGLIVGLSAATNSRGVIIGGIITIAFADAFSDALGIHISQESQSSHSVRHIWESTISTFIVKLFFALTFIIPVLFLNINLALYLSIIWGFLLLSIFSFITAKQRKENKIRAILEHLLIGILVVIITYFIGNFVNNFFK